MKRFLYIILIIMALVALSACGKPAEKTARNFFDAMEQQDFAKAKNFVTEEGQELLTMIESFANSMSEEQKDEMVAMRYNITEVIEEGDAATVRFQQWEVENPDNIQDQELKLVKVDGNWKVDLAKDDIDK
jgi:predicted small lipoprotein YifL